MKDELKRFIRKKFLKYAEDNESTEYPGLHQYTLIEGNTSSDLDDFIDDLLNDIKLVIKVAKMLDEEE